MNSWVSPHRTGYDQRRSCIVDQHGVHLVDYGIIVFSLHQFGGRVGHVIPQIIESEFIVGPEGDIAFVCLPPGL